MSDFEDTILDEVILLVPALTDTLDRLAAIGRQMHPPRLPALVETIGDQDASLEASMQRFRAADWPPRLIGVRDQLGAAAEFALSACAGLRAAVAPGGNPNDAFRSLGDYTRAVEALYPLAPALSLIGRWFLNPPQRDDPALLERLRKGGPGTGVAHSHNDRGTRGGFSVYIPEYQDPAIPSPIVMTLHGGSGHGRQQLWSWIREARGRGLIVVAPTSIGRTWALNDPDIDGPHLEQILAQIRSRWAIDPDRMLLTGISDGGTFTWLSGLIETSPFTHLAPIAASFHPVLLEISDPQRTVDLPIYLVHGAKDWMFPVDIARMASYTMTDAGARVTYREIADLSHTYPTEENDRIIDWLLTS